MEREAWKDQEEKNHGQCNPMAQQKRNHKLSWWKISRTDLWKAWSPTTAPNNDERRLSELFWHHSVQCCSTNVGSLPNPPWSRDLLPTTLPYSSVSHYMMCVRHFTEIIKYCIALLSMTTTSWAFPACSDKLLSASIPRIWMKLSVSLIRLNLTFLNCFLKWFTGKLNSYMTHTIAAEWYKFQFSTDRTLHFNYMFFFSSDHFPFSMTFIGYVHFSSFVDLSQVISSIHLLLIKRIPFEGRCTLKEKRRSW